LCYRRDDLSRGRYDDSGSSPLQLLVQALALRPGDTAIGHVRFYRNAAIHLAVISYTEAGRWLPGFIRQPKN
jgi:hypothetical protein